MDSIIINKFKKIQSFCQLPNPKKKECIQRHRKKYILKKSILDYMKTLYTTLKNLNKKVK